MKIIIYDVIPAIELIKKDVVQLFELDKKDTGIEVSLNKLSEEKQGSTCVCYQVQNGTHRGNILKEFYPKDKEFLPNFLTREECGEGYLGKLTFNDKSIVNKKKFNQYYDRFINQINSMADVQKVYEDRCLFDALDLQVANTSIGLCFLCRELKDIDDFKLRSVNKSEKEKENILYDIVVKAFRQIQEIKRLHDVGYACLDCKPGNFCNVVVEKDELASIKLVDYGSALNKESFYKYLDDIKDIDDSLHGIFTSNLLYYLESDLDNVVEKASESDFDFSIVQSLDLKAIAIYILSELNKYFVPECIYDSEQLCKKRFDLIKQVVVALSGVAQNYDLLELYFYLTEAIDYLLNYENKPTCVEALKKLTKPFIKLGKPDFIVGELDKLYNKEKQISEETKSSIQQFNQKFLSDLYKYSDSKVVLRHIDKCIEEKLNDMGAYILHNILKEIF